MIGCSASVVIHPIEKSDIFFVAKGSVVVDPKEINGQMVEKDGYFLSELYVNEVMKAKVK